MHAAPRYWLAVVALVVLQHWFANAYMFLKPFKFGKGKCVDTQFQSHPIGEQWYENVKCEKHECVFLKRRNMLFVRGYGCGAIGYAEGCRLVPGNGDQYPDCCPQVACHNGADFFYDDDEDEDDVGNEDTKVANGDAER